MLDSRYGLYIAHSENGPISLCGRMANRHGLIAGATGTGKTISLQPEDLMKKLVTEKRGGYCFEMNALFCEAVKALGIPIYGVLARVAAGPGG